MCLSASKAGDKGKVRKNFPLGGGGDAHLYTTPSSYRLNVKRRGSSDTLETKMPMICSVFEMASRYSFRAITYVAN